MIVNKDTLIFASFAKTAGNNGCLMFNPVFEYYGLNAIYKSFSVIDISNAINAARVLNFGGFAVTMPFKKDALKYVDELSEEVKQIGALNTVVNTNGWLKAYNTDYLAAKTILESFNKTKPLYILGNGGYAAAVIYAAKTLNLQYYIINRLNWNNIGDIKDSIIYNCTPVNNIHMNESNIFIDCLVTTPTGQHLSKIQASHQFKLYTNIEHNF